MPQISDGLLAVYPWLGNTLSSILAFLIFFAEADWLMLGVVGVAGASNIRRSSHPKKFFRFFPKSILFFFFFWRDFSLLA